ncbi:MAG TPA: hypothetical protein VI997_05165 [Candidatus Thermoplasmatota archaeon]|nr:hypothetical protein [Candidatus Thermoplasmatota archaeon]
MRVAVAVVLALAGCLSAPIPSPAPDGVLLGEVGDAFARDHDHSDAALHALGTPTMAQLAYTPLGPDGKPYHYIGEIAAHGDLAYVAIEGGATFEEPSGFVVVDVSDPAAPRVVARAEAPWATAHDVKVDPSGQWLYQGSQGIVNRPLVDVARVAEARGLAGIVVWDVRDPSAPKQVSYAEVAPEGCHMLSVAEVAGSTHVYCATNDHGLRAFVARDTPNGRELVPEGLYVPTGVGPGSAPLGLSRPAGPHDATFQPDPLTGEPLLVLAHGDNGVDLASLADPARPTDLGRWTGEGARHWHGAIHSAMAYRVGDRRIVVATPELYTDDVPAVFFLDATDTARISLVREWLAPGLVGADFFRTTTHQIQVVEGRVYLSFNHAGVWVLDASTSAKVADPVILGLYLPHEQAVAKEDPAKNVPFVWDVVVHRGAILASDRQTGLYVLHLEGDAFADEVGSFA